MAVCEMCGRNAALARALVEGTEMDVCAACGRHGQVLRRPKAPQKRKPQAKPETVEVVVGDCAQKIRRAREKRGVSQKDFARSLNEKESVIHKLENGSFRPSLSLARKLEKLLGVTLVEEETSAPVTTKQKGAGPLTIGDILKAK